MTRIPPHERPEVARPDDVDDDAVLSVFRVPKEMSGMRADVFLSTQLKNTSRTRAKVIVLAAARYLDGSRVKPNTRLAPEQYVALWRPPWDETEVPRDIPILFQDDHLLIVDKPPGLPVHPSARYYRNTVVKMLGERFPSEHLVLGHRLDRDTSGVLVLARTFEADRRIKKQFSNKVDVHKAYQAITWGWPTLDQQRVDHPLERDPDSRLRCSMRVAAPGTGLHAATQVSVLRKYRRDGHPYALVRCDLETGRQHQIRVHLASLGCPVVGDKLYGPDEQLHARASDGTLTAEDFEQLELARHALHAWRMEFSHPITGVRLEVVAPLPSDMRAFLDELEPIHET